MMRGVQVREWLVNLRKIKKTGRNYDSKLTVVGGIVEDRFLWIQAVVELFPSCVIDV
jgi:hypothetical protein